MILTIVLVLVLVLILETLELVFRTDEGFSVQV